MLLLWFHLCFGLLLCFSNAEKFIIRMEEEINVKKK